MFFYLGKIEGGLAGKGKSEGGISGSERTKEVDEAFDIFVLGKSADVEKVGVLREGWGVRDKKRGIDAIADVDHFGSWKLEFRM